MITYLKSKRAWKLWKRRESFNLVNRNAEPVEFPCFVYLVCESFAYEEEGARYLYKDDIRRMADKIGVTQRGGATDGT